MKPDRPGYWWYTDNGEWTVARVFNSHDYGLAFELPGVWRTYAVGILDVAWGPEILPPCKERTSMCKTDNMSCGFETCFGKCSRKDPQTHLSARGE
jgi:hypothetical protein